MEENISFENLPKAVQKLNEKLSKIEQLLIFNTSKKEQENKDQLLTVEQAADFLSLSVPTIYSKISRGELPNYKRGKRVYFTRNSLMNHLKQGERKTFSEIEKEAENYLKNKK